MTPERPAPRFCVHIFWAVNDGVGTMQVQTATLADAKTILAEVMSKSTGKQVDPQSVRSIMVKHGPTHLWEMTCKDSPPIWAKAHMLDMSCPPAWTRSVQT